MRTPTATPQGQPLDDSVQYRFEAQSGFHAVQDPSSRGSRQYSGQVLKQIAARSFTAPGTQDAAKALMRAALAPLLGDKPLTSRKMFQR